MNGTELENFVARLEQALVPAGFTVETRRREFSADGVQIAELDIVISGRVGSSPVTCLIECRDRPSEGSAPGSWIEQLVGRRSRFRFDKVMAVSTTGYAPGAIEFAKEAGVSLRGANELTAEGVADWFQAQTFDVVHRTIHLEYAKIFISDTEPAHRANAATVAIQAASLDQPFLKNPKTGERVRPVDAFTIALSRRPTLWPEDPNQTWSDRVEIDACYPTTDSYELETSVGAVAVPRILFRGVIGLKVDSVPFTRFAEYTDELAGDRIASSVEADLNMEGERYMVSLDKLTVDGVDGLAVRMARRK